MRKQGSFFQSWSIAQSLILTFSVIILFVTAFMTYWTFYSVDRELEISATEYTDHLLHRVNAELEQYVEYMKDVSDYVSNNPTILEFLQLGTGEYRRDQRENIAQQLLSLAQIRREVGLIALLSASGEVVLSDPDHELNRYADYIHSQWYQSAMENPGQVYVSSSHVQNLIDGEYNWVISFAKAIVGPEREILGVLLLDLSYDKINQICNSVDLGDRGYIYILDRNGDVLWHPRQDMIYANLWDQRPDTVPDMGEGSKGVLEISLKSDVTAWTLVGVAYLAELQKDPSATYQIILLTALAAILIAVVLTVLITRAITGPLTHLSAVMQQVEQGDFTVRSQVVGNNEVAQLSKNVNHMIAHTQELMEELVAKEEQKRRTEWQVLQAQIKPHFIYNTLDSVIWMCRSGQVEAAAKMTSALAVLLRRSIGSDREIIPLEEEIQHIKSYLVIQKMRYAEKLRYRLDIEPETLSCRIPRLIIQPLVENAIYHGIKVKEDGGTIYIGAVCEDDQLLITVEDDGVGMTQEQLAHLFDAPEAGRRSRIGIRNVYDRIKAYLGPDYGLRFYSEPDKGTTAILNLPVIREEGPYEA